MAVLPKVRVMNYCRLANIHAAGKLILMFYYCFAMLPAQLGRLVGIVIGLRAGRPRNHCTIPGRGN